MTQRDMTIRREPVFDQIGLAFQAMLAQIPPQHRNELELKRRALRRVLRGDNVRLSTLVDLATGCGYTVKVTLEKV